MQEKKTVEKSTLRFRGMFNPIPSGYVSNAGDKIKETFRVVAPYEVDEKGECLNPSPYPKRVSSGMVDIQARIDSFRQETELKYILKHLNELNLGSLAFTDQSPYQMDTTELPQNKVELAAALKANEELKASLASAIDNLNRKTAEVKAAGTEGASEPLSLSQDEIKAFRDFMKERNKSNA